MLWLKNTITHAKRSWGARVFSCSAISSLDFQNSSKILPFVYQFSTCNVTSVPCLRRPCLFTFNTRTLDGYYQFQHSVVLFFVCIIIDGHFRVLNVEQIFRLIVINFCHLLFSHRLLVVVGISHDNFRPQLLGSHWYFSIDKQSIKRIYWHSIK